jgi:hypothetical protein
MYSNLRIIFKGETPRSRHQRLVVVRPERRAADRRQRTVPGG